MRRAAAPLAWQRGPSRTFFSLSPAAAALSSVARINLQQPTTTTAAAGSASTDSISVSDVGVGQNDQQEKPPKLAPFTLPAILRPATDPLAPSERHLAYYPWLLSNSPPRIPPPTLWSALSQKHLYRTGLLRAQKHMQGNAYAMPMFFEADAALVVTELFEALSDPDRASSVDKLHPDLMTRGLATRLVKGYESLLQRGHRIRFNMHSSPAVKITGWHFTYGPSPTPPGYVDQSWVSLYTLIIPREDANFVSIQKQRAVMKAAEDAGVHFRIDCAVDLDIEVVVETRDSGMPIMRDRRRRLEMSFISPHFTPWDEIFDLVQKTPGGEATWVLRWKWRVADIDRLIFASLPPLKEIKIQWGLSEGWGPWKAEKRIEAAPSAGQPDLIASQSAPPVDDKKQQ